MNSAEGAVQWRLGGGTLVCALGLLLCLGALARVPGWWRGTYNSGRSLGRQRTYLVQWAGCAFLAVGALIGTLIPEDSDQISLGQAWLGLTPMIVGVLFLLLIPLVWHFAAFEFLVPPGLRRDVAGGPPDFGPGDPLTAALAAARNAPPRAAARTPATTGPDGSGTLRFERPRGGRRDWFVGYRVEIDGGEVGSLRRGGELAVSVAAGVHAVRGAVSFTGSPTIEVHVRAGETTVVSIRPGTGDPLVQVAGPDSYLTIEVADE